MGSSSDDSDCCPEVDEDEERIDTSQSSSSDDDDDHDGGDRKLNHDASKRPRCPIHAALVGAGIKLRSRETRPLLRALGVGPQHLVKLSLVERRTLLGLRLNDGGSCGRGRPRSRRPHSPPPQAPWHGRHGSLGRSKPRTHGRLLPSGVAQGPPPRPADGGCHRSRERRLEEKDERRRKHPLRHTSHGPPHHAGHSRLPPPSGEEHRRHGPGPKYMDIDDSEQEEGMLSRGEPPARPRVGGRHGPCLHGRPMHGRHPAGFGVHPSQGAVHHPHGACHDSSGREGEEGSGMVRDPEKHGFGRPRHGGQDGGGRCHAGRGHRHSAGECEQHAAAFFQPSHEICEPAGPPGVDMWFQQQLHGRMDAHCTHHLSNRPLPPPSARMMAVS